MKERLEQLRAWMEAREDEHLEFKEAKARFDFEELVKYSCALANERGGRIILGVTDKRPRRVVGTAAFQNLERTKAGLVERLHLRVEVEELAHPDGRVVVFHVPSRPVGMPGQYKGAYWMRAGDGLAPMTPDMLQRIFAEAQPDFSAQRCLGAHIEDLDPVAVARFRSRWAEKSRRPDLTEAPLPRLLEDAELLVDGAVTYAALILLGTSPALGRHLAQAEVIFEYRADEAAIEYQQRKEYREGFLLFHDDLWNTVNLRNTVFSYQDGLFRREIPALNEGAVREGILKRSAIVTIGWRVRPSCVSARPKSRSSVRAVFLPRLRQRPSFSDNRPGTGASPRRWRSVAWSSGPGRGQTGCSRPPCGRGSSRRISVGAMRIR